MLQPTVETITTDILILGSGGAGLLAALHAHDANPRASIVITVKGGMRLWLEPVQFTRLPPPAAVAPAVEQAYLAQEGE
jgi:thioredoxin reductase